MENLLQWVKDFTLKEKLKKEFVMDLVFTTNNNLIESLDVFYTENSISRISEVLERLPEDFSDILDGTFNNDENFHKFVAFYSRGCVFFLAPNNFKNRIIFERDTANYKIGIYCNELFDFVIQQVEADVYPLTIPLLKDIKLESFPTNP